MNYRLSESKFMIRNKTRITQAERIHTGSFAIRSLIRANLSHPCNESADIRGDKI